MQNVNPANANQADSILAQYGLHRSPKWPQVEKAHLKSEPTCAACGQTGSQLQVHHVIPFHFCILLGRPELELDERNLLTLCEGAGTCNHHLVLGHLDCWGSYNPSIRADVIGVYKGWNEAQIQADAAWEQMKQKRPLEWQHMSDADKTALRQLMDTLYPITITQN